MGGIFSKSNRPKRPGAYFNFQAQVPEPTLANALGILAIPFVHSWGPSEEVVDLGSWGDFLAIFGAGDPAAALTPGYIAVKQAFRGEGLPGRGGAGRVLAYRMSGSSAAKASHALSNGTTGAITLHAVYEGSFGNKLKVAVVANAKNPTTQHDLVIFDGTIEVERFTYNKTDITDLAAQINGTTPYTPITKSDWVTADTVTSGTALTVVSTPAALTGGDDGSTLTSTDWTNAMTAFEAQRFTLLAPYDLLDSSILTSFLTWEQNLNSKGKRFMLVVGGAAGESAATAVARSVSLDDPNIVNVGIGTYTDDELGVLSTSQLAPRIAGILAAKAESGDATFARLAGLSITVGATEADILSALDGGVVTIAKDSHPSAPTRLEKALTTFSDKNNTDRPYDIYSVPKFVRVMDGLETELTEFAEQNVIGQMPVNAATRQFLVGQMKARMAVREAAGIIQPGWTVDVDNDPPPQETDDFVALKYQLKFGRTLNQVLNTVTVG